MYRICIFISLFCILIGEENLNDISLKEKIAQMIMVRVDGEFHNSEDWSKKNLEILIKDRKVGGVIIFGGNVHGASYNLNELQDMSSIPLFVAADYERGLGQWIGGTLFPTNMAVAATQNKNYAYEQGRITAIEASSIGVNMVFAPVLDINNNPENPIINFRSYSDDPNIVSKFGLSFIRGIQDNGLIACAKHYPGHGDTNIDSHSSLPIINKSKDELFANELKPFQEACAGGVKSIMVGHIVLPSLDNTLKPASHSYEITYNILRNKWNYDGLIITDGLEMGALNDNTWEGESAIRAVEAGADIVLLPKNTTRAINAIYDAVISGRISEDRINYSFNKIIDEKKKLGLFDKKNNDWEEVLDNVGLNNHKSISSKIANESITIVKDDDNLVPINPSKYKKITHILLSVDEDAKSKLNYFAKQIQYTHGNVQEILINDKLTNKGIDDIKDRIKDSDLIIVSMLIRIKMDNGQSTIDDSHFRAY